MQAHRKDNLPLPTERRLRQAIASLLPHQSLPCLARSGITYLLPVSSQTGGHEDRMYFTGKIRWSLTRSSHNYKSTADCVLPAPPKGSYLRM